MIDRKNLLEVGQRLYKVYEVLETDFAAAKKRLKVSCGWFDSTVC